jgi:hypothetical protein
MLPVPRNPIVCVSFTVDALYQKRGYDHAMSERRRVPYWSDLYAGEVDDLLAAWRANKLDRMRGLVDHFHMPYLMAGPWGVYPESIDLLTTITYNAVGAKRTDFQKSWRKHVENERGSFHWMSMGWVALFAGLDNKQITMVGRKWADDCDRFLKNKKFFLDIVRGVARVCKEAQKDDRTDVVYTFSSVPA